MENLSNRNNRVLPVSFRVIGFGNRSQNIISQINSINYSGVEAFICDNINVSPEDEDEMVILINPSNKDIKSFAKTFYQAGVLTLIISSKDLNKVKDCFDSFSKVSQRKILPTLKGILDPLFHFGPISFDINEIKEILKDSEKFLIKKFEIELTDNYLDGSSEIISNELKEIKNIENFSFILTCNHNTSKPFVNSVIERFHVYVNSLPENVYLWGVQYDENLKQNQIKVTTILSGKNLISNK